MDVPCVSCPIGVHFARTVDELRRRTPLGVAAIVDALEVEVAHVVREIVAQREEAWHERARERRTPALFEDGALYPLDAAIGLRSAHDALHGADAAHVAAERLCDELAAAVRRDRPDLPARRGQLRSDAAHQS